MHFFRLRSLKQIYISEAKVRKTIIYFISDWSITWNILYILRVNVYFPFSFTYTNHHLPTKKGRKNNLKELNPSFKVGWKTKRCFKSCLEMSLYAKGPSTFDINFLTYLVSSKSALRQTLGVFGSAGHN